MWKLLAHVVIHWLLLKPWVALVTIFYIAKWLDLFELASQLPTYPSKPKREWEVNQKRRKINPLLLLILLYNLQVLNEDLRLVIGQQDRMINGANIWNLPVAYDKLGVRYRIWRDAVERGAKQLPFSEWAYNESQITGYLLSCYFWTSPQQGAIVVFQHTSGTMSKFGRSTRFSRRSNRAFSY